MWRRGAWLLAVGALLTALACEEGEIPDPPPGNGGGSTTLDLVQVTLSPSRGDAITFEATVTTDGMPDSGVTVTFTAENPSLTGGESFNPSSSQTDFQGTASTILNTRPTSPTTFTVRATTPTGSADTVTVSLAP